MGIVNFNTDITKLVDFDKTVDLDVIKTVTSTVNLTGYLATAEASADALPNPFGGGGNGGGASTTITILLDDFEDTQTVTANALIGPNPASDTLAISTDIPFLERTFFVEVLGAEGEAQVGSNNPVASRLDFSSSDAAQSNALVSYALPGGVAFDATPGLSDAEILADPTAATFTVSNINWNPGTGADDQPATLRVSLFIVDDDGDIAISTAAYVGDGFTGLDISDSIAVLLDETAGGFTPGDVIAGTATDGIIFIGAEDDVDGDGGGVDTDAIVQIGIFQEDDPDVITDGNTFATGDLFAVDSVIEENLSVSGTDQSVDDLTITLTIPGDEPGEGGVLAETDVFAQVDATGAFSFAEALAASSAAVDGGDILI